MKILLILLLSVTKVFALEAVVTVLETPLLSDRDINSPVVQYLRKGDVIKLHPSVGNDRTIDQYAPGPNKLKELKEKLLEDSSYNQDPLFKGEAGNTFYLEDELVPTLDRRGQVAWVQAEHLYVYFNDARELNQRKLDKDPTDYRLDEPLPKNYPLPQPNGFKGQFILGLTQPWTEAYPYKSKIGTQGYQSPIDGNFTLMRRAEGNYRDRFYIGGTLGFRTYENAYTFPDSHVSKERAWKVGAGPTFAYDAFRTEKDRITLLGTILINFFDRLEIEQKNANILDRRDYQGMGLAPRFHVQYQRKNVLEEIDFVVGTGFEIGTPTTYRAKNGGKVDAWWRNLGSDKFTTRTTFSLGGYVGIQSAY